MAVRQIKARPNEGKVKQNKKTKMLKNENFQHKLYVYIICNTKRIKSMTYTE